MLILVPSRLEAERLVPEAAPGSDPVDWPGRRAPGGGAVRVALCGVGVALAGARTARLLAVERPASVVLAGLAGSLDPAAPPGSLVLGASVELHGIGVGEGEGHLSLSAAGGALAAEAGEAEAPLDLAPPSGVGGLPGPLLTACAGAVSREEARSRRARHPGCLAEDMESWAVARAAAEAGVALSVLRGVSNEAGDREHERWRLDEAFAALRAGLEALTEEAP